MYKQNVIERIDIPSIQFAPVLLSNKIKFVVIGMTVLVINFMTSNSPHIRSVCLQIR